MSYLEIANSLPLYLVVGVVLFFIAGLCVLFIVKSYRAGLAIGMDRKVLKKAITSSASFTVLPSVSILLGVIALSGSLGVPVSWLRLSVIGNLQYEATVAEMAAESMGKALDSSVLNLNNLVTILAVMTFGIIWGCLLSIFTLNCDDDRPLLRVRRFIYGDGDTLNGIHTVLHGSCVRSFHGAF